MLTAMLLVSFTLSALAVVGAVGWLGRTDSPLVVVGAVALALALTALVLGRLVAMLPERPHMVRYPSTFWLVPGVAAVALLAPLGVPSVAHPPTHPSSSPAGTVRGFLGAVIDNDGVTACRYLTGRARAEAAGHACQGFFGGVSLRLGGRLMTTDAQLDRLSYVTRGHVVTVGGGRFVLARATPAARAEFMAPPTAWRISSNVRWLSRSSGRAAEAGRERRALPPCAATTRPGTRRRSARCGAPAGSRRTRTRSAPSSRL
jgi:hypothetical protein